MTVDAAVPRSRRAIIAGAIGAAVASVASALGRPAPVGATDGDVIVVGGEYDSQSRTYIYNNFNAATVIEAGSSTGVGVVGSSSSGTGVIGSSITDVGVAGSAQSGIGVRALSGAAGQPASLGRSTGNSTGVQGYSGSDVPPPAKPKTGVFGSAAQDGSARGVWGDSPAGTGVYGASSTGYGVYGQSTSNIAVYGDSSSNIGLYGTTFAANQPASLGWSYGNSTGVQGHSGAGAPPAVQPKTGVFGYAAQDSGSRGVVGESPAGQGVRGTSSTGLGVRGFSQSGVAGSFETTSGVALATKGRLRFADVAGKSTISAGTSSVTVNPGVSLTSSSFVLATLNGDAGGSTVVKRVAINAAADTFTIHLTANSTNTISVAWFILEQ